MTLMRSEHNLAQIIIAAPGGGKGVQYLAPPDLVMILIWFLGSIPARATALTAYSLILDSQKWIDRIKNRLTGFKIKLWMTGYIFRLILWEARYAA